MQCLLNFISAARNKNIDSTFLFWRPSGILTFLTIKRICSVFWTNNNFCMSAISKMNIFHRKQKSFRVIWSLPCSQIVSLDLYLNGLRTDTYLTYRRSNPLQWILLVLLYHCMIIKFWAYIFPCHCRIWNSRTRVSCQQLPKDQNHTIQGNEFSNLQ